MNARNDSIRKALDAADKAREEMKKLQADNEKILEEARAERDALMKEARNMKDKLIGEARDKASAEASRIIKAARDSIRAEQATAINDMKRQMAELSVSIAEKLIRLKLKEDKEQKELVKKLIEDIDLN